MKPERPPFFADIGNAFLEYEKTYAADKLTAYQQLASDVDEIRTKVAVKISAHSDGQDGLESPNFNIRVQATGPENLRWEIVHGYSARGLYRAVLNSRWIESMNKYDDIRIVFTFRGTTSHLSPEDQSAARALADTKGELTELVAWCRDYMKEWE